MTGVRTSAAVGVMPPFAHRGDLACEPAHAELFFPPENRADAPHAAMQLCLSCPAQVECANWAVDERLRFGVWGGTTPRDREEIWAREDSTAGGGR